MQMFYVDYSWYGAGFVRWGVRGPDGNIIYVHKIANNNVNPEAYMRSGNLPGRYEVSADPITTTLTGNVLTTDTVINVANAANFPPSGTLVLRPGSTANQASSLYEYVNYTGRTATSFTGLTRAQAGSAVNGIATTWTTGSNSGVVSSAAGIQIGQRVFGVANPSPVPDGTYVTAINGTTITLSREITATSPTLIFANMSTGSAQAYTFSATSPVAVELAFPSYAPTLSHWGTSAIMDGRFDDDKSLVFTFGNTAVTTIAAGAQVALVGIRVAPSADNGQIGAFGAREVINRMQLKLDSFGIVQTTTAQPLLITAVLNGTPSTATAWTNAVQNAVGVTNSSLAQVANFQGLGTTISGGEVAGGFFSNGPTDRIDLTSVRDLGNSILGGGGPNANSQIYPDGPDTITIVVRNVGSASATVFGRLGWNEAQA
jgi:hypothetical protein